MKRSIANETEKKFENKGQCAMEHRKDNEFPELMTEAELVRYLRIPEISEAGDHSNVVSNLKRMHDLPCIHISKQPLYPLNAVRKWLDEKLSKEKKG